MAQLLLPESTPEVRYRNTLKVMHDDRTGYHSPSAFWGRVNSAWKDELRSNILLQPLEYYNFRRVSEMDFHAEVEKTAKFYGNNMPEKEFKVKAIGQFVEPIGLSPQTKKLFDELAKFWIEYYKWRDYILYSPFINMKNQVDKSMIVQADQPDFLIPKETAAGYEIRDFKKLATPVKQGILEPLIYEGTVLSALDGEQKVQWNKFGKPINYQATGYYVQVRRPDSLMIMNVFKIADLNWPMISDGLHHWLKGREFYKDQVLTEHLYEIERLIDDANDQAEYANSAFMVGIISELQLIKDLLVENDIAYFRIIVE